MIGSWISVSEKRVYRALRFRWWYSPVMSQNVFVRATLTLAISLGIWALSGGPQIVRANQDSRTANYEDAEAYAIYAVVLQATNHSHPVIQTEMLYDRTATLENIGITGDANFRKVWGAALKDYVARYRSPMHLARAIPTSLQYELLSDTKFSEVMKSGGWGNFYKQYPDSGGYITFSPVGFDDSRTHAIAYVGTACGPLCGLWSSRFFEKQNGKWTEVSVHAKRSIRAS
jgi:hypothetical protein